MGVTSRSTVKNAAKLAVYEDMTISVKNHQTEPTMRPDIDLYEKVMLSITTINVFPRGFKYLNTQYQTHQKYVFVLCIKPYF